MCPSPGGDRRHRGGYLSAHQQRGGYLDASSLRHARPPCSRRYSYACHAPRGLGRGAPEGKGYADDFSTLLFRWSCLNASSVTPWVCQGGKSTPASLGEGQRVDSNCARVHAYPAASYGQPGAIIMYKIKFEKQWQQIVIHIYERRIY
jgi:hypothetical protein